jgi:hypothetical protein
MYQPQISVPISLGKFPINGWNSTAVARSSQPFSMIQTLLPMKRIPLHPNLHEIRQTQIAKLIPTPRTCHMITPSLLHKQRLALRTSLSNFLHQSRRGSVVFGGLLNAFIVVGAEFAFVPGDVVDCAGFVGAGLAGEDWVVYTTRVELAYATGWREAVAVFAHCVEAGLCC